MIEVKELQQLIDLYHGNKLAHAYLIETNDINKTYLELLNVIKNIVCPEKYSDNCQKCNICNLINNNYLPSLIVVETEEKAIKKNQIEELKSRFSSMPLYTKDNIYIIKEAEKLNSASANIMLKFLEEPENNILGFFLTNNVNNVINTIQSRCEIIRIKYQKQDTEITDSTYFENVVNYLKKLELEKTDTIMYNKTALLNIYTDRMDYIEIFKLILKIYNKIIEAKINLFQNELTKKLFFIYDQNLNILIKKEEIINKYLDDLNYNVNIELFLDRFVIELSDLNE